MGLRKVRGYYQNTGNGQVFVRSDTGKYTQDEIVTSKGGGRSAQGYDIVDAPVEENTSSKREPIPDFVTLATGSDKMSIANPTLKPIYRNGQLVGVQDKALQQSYMVKRGTTIQDLRRIESARAGFRISQAIQLQRQYSKPVGVVSDATPKTLSQKLSNFYNKQLTLKQKSESRGRYFETLYRGTIVLGSLGVARGLVGVKDTIFHPIQTTKDTIQVIRHPVQFLQSEGERFRVDPVGVVAEYYTFGKAMNGVLKVSKRSPVGRFVLEELYIRKQPKELQAYVRAIIKSAEVQRKINPYRVESIGKVDFAQVKSLSKTEAKALARTIRRTDTVVFGSLASRTLSKGKTSLPKDVDLATANIRTFGNHFIKELPSRVRRNYFLKGEKLYRRSNGQALFDIKPLNRLYPDKGLFSKKGFLPVSGYVKRVAFKKGSILPRLKSKRVSGALEIPTSKTVSVKGIRLVGFGEQTLRKGLGTLQVLIERNKKRAKDPQGFIKGLQIQIEGLKRSRPKTKLGRMVKASKIKRLQSALDILTTKKFAKLLNKKVPGLTREFPLVAKIDAKKLRRAEKLPRAKVKGIVDRQSRKDEVRFRSKSSSSRLRRASAGKSYLPKARRSRLAKSRLSRKSGYARGKVRASRIPGKSRLRKSGYSRSSKVSRSMMSSKLASSRLGMSKLPKSMLKGLAPSKLRALKLKFSPVKVKFFKRLSKNKLFRKKIVRELKSIPKVYRPSLEAVIFNIVARKRPGKISGLEVRPIIRALAVSKKKRMRISRKVKRVRSRVSRKRARSRIVRRAKVRRSKRRTRRSRKSRRLRRVRSRRLRRARSRLRRKLRRSRKKRSRGIMGFLPTRF